MLHMITVERQVAMVLVLPHSMCLSSSTDIQAVNVQVKYSAVL